MSKRITLICLLALIAGAVVATAQDEAETPEAAEGQAVITNPAPDALLFGDVQITGSADHPEFQSFQLDFATADQPEDWLSIQGPTSQKVTDGVLGVWSVTSLPDGVYRLRLLVFLRNGDAFETVVEDLQVSNTRPTDVPTVLPSPTEPPTQPPPTAGPSPTPIIWQPPTTTPRPGGGAPAAGAGSAEAGGADEDNWLSGGRLRSALCNGVYLTLIVVALVGLYMSVRSSLRPWLRRQFRRR